MRKASSSLLVLTFAALLASFQSFAGPGPRAGQQGIIQERVAHSFRSFERFRVSDLLRLSPQESHLEIKSLSLTAESLMHGSAEIELLQFGRLLATEIIRRNKREVRIILPPMTKIVDLELMAKGDVYLETLSAEVEGKHPQGTPPGYVEQVRPNAFLTLHLNRQTRGLEELPLRRLVKEQLGLSLEGAQIERVVVQGKPLSYQRSASVQLKLNQRVIGPVKYLSPSQGRMPIPVQSNEEVQNLRLIVSGDAFIETISIRVGQVRALRPELPTQSRIFVNQEVRPHMPLELSRVLGYDSRLIRSISIEARSLRGPQAQIMLMTSFNEFQGLIHLNKQSARAKILLHRPLPAHELRIESHSRALIESLEVEFES